MEGCSQSWSIHSAALMEYLGEMNGHKEGVLSGWTYEQRSEHRCDTGMVSRRCVFSSASPRYASRLRSMSTESTGRDAFPCSPSTSPSTVRLGSSSTSDKESGRMLAIKQIYLLNHSFIYKRVYIHIGIEYTGLTKQPRMRCLFHESVSFNN